MAFDIYTRMKELAAQRAVTGVTQPNQNYGVQPVINLQPQSTQNTSTQVTGMMIPSTPWYLKAVATPVGPALQMVEGTPQPNTHIAPLSTSNTASQTQPTGLVYQTVDGPLNIAPPQPSTVVQSTAPATVKDRQPFHFEPFTLDSGEPALKVVKGSWGLPATTLAPVVSPADIPVASQLPPSDTQPATTPVVYQNEAERHGVGWAYPKILTTTKYSELTPDTPRLDISNISIIGSPRRDTSDSYSAYFKQLRTQREAQSTDLEQWFLRPSSQIKLTYNPPLKESFPEGLKPFNYGKETILNRGAILSSISRIGADRTFENLKFIYPDDKETISALEEAYKKLVQTQTLQKATLEQGSKPRTCGKATPITKNKRLQNLMPSFLQYNETTDNPAYIPRWSFGRTQEYTTAKPKSKQPKNTKPQRKPKQKQKKRTTIKSTPSPLTTFLASGSKMQSKWLRW